MARCGRDIVLRGSVCPAAYSVARIVGIEHDGFDSGDNQSGSEYPSVPHSRTLDLELRRVSGTHTHACVIRAAYEVSLAPETVVWRTHPRLERVRAIIDYPPHPQYQSCVISFSASATRDGVGPPRVVEQCQFTSHMRTSPTIQPSASHASHASSAQIQRVH